MTDNDMPLPEPLAEAVRAWAEDIDNAPITATGWPLVRKDYGPRGACAPKAALLVLVPALLVRLGVRKARRR